MRKRKKLGQWNAVRGCPGWSYSILVRIENGRAVLFSVHNEETGITLRNLIGSAYRTTTIASIMGEKNLRGYQHVARTAIREFERNKR